MAVTLDAAQIADLARRLRAIPFDAEWREEPVRRLAADLGWSWSEGPDGPLLDAGLPTGPVRMEPISQFPEAYFALRNYQEMHVPVVSSETDPAVLADGFRAAAEAVTGELGLSSVMGTHGHRGPFGMPPPAWGSPFRRWRNLAGSVELRAVDGGVDLVAMPNERIDDWHWDSANRGGDGSLGGFWCMRDRARENITLDVPRGWVIDGDWEAVTRRWARELSRWPAEFRALGIGVDLLIVGPGVSIHLYCDGTLQLATDEYTEREPAGGFADLGWRRADPAEPPRFSQPPVWVSPEFGAGAAVPGAGPAELLVATLRELGVAAPQAVDLGDWSETVGRFDTAEQHTARFFGLGLMEWERRKRG